MEELSMRPQPRRLARRLIARAVFLAALTAGTVASAFQGPYASIVTGFGGFALDLDVRWPDGPPPVGGWPVVFWGHGAGGDKTTSAFATQRYSNDGYVTLTWTNRSTASNPSAEVIAADIVALKSWLVNDFQAEAGVTVPVDPARFGMTGGSLGGYTSWSGGLRSNAFATIVPYGWGIHFFTDGVTLNGSIDRITGGPRAATFPTPYDDVSLDAGFDAIFTPLVDALSTTTIPIMTQMGIMDARTGGTYAMADYLALTSTPARFIYIGTGGHGTPDTDDEFRADLRDRWFAHFLQGASNGIDTELPIQVALLGTNEHLAYASWPPPGQANATVWLRSAGVLSPAPPSVAAPPATLVNDPGTYTWAISEPNFPPNQIRNNVVKQTVAWQTAPLTDEVLLIGQPRVRLELAGTGSRYQVNVHLYDAQDGFDPLLIGTTSATVGTSPTVVDIALSLTARRVPAGHRLRLEITNRDDQDLDYTNGFNPSSETLRHIPFFELSTTQISQDVLRPSSLTLPLVGRTALPLPGVACDPTPRIGCRLPSAAGASPLTLKNLVPDTKDALTWKWSKGTTTSFAELGDPRTDDAYAFCLYDGSGALVLDAVAPAAGTCGTKPCWKQLGATANPKGFQYADKDLTPDGLSKVQVQAGVTPKAKAIVSGKGTALGVPSLPLALPVAAQLQTTNLCWAVTYGTAQLNGPSVFKAK
jgi:hypothetical protein